MIKPADAQEKTPLHLPTALGCLALQCLFIGMCLYHNATIHDFDGTLSTISFSCIYLATQALIWLIVASRFMRWNGSRSASWTELRIPIALALSCVMAIVALVASPHIADRFLALSNPVMLSADGTEVRISGSIPSNLAADIRRVCANGACVSARTVVLGSDGGSFVGAFEGLEVLKDVGVKRASVSGSCNSACVAIWAGFGNAVVPPGSVIGIQGVYDPLTGQATISSTLQTQHLRELLLAQGLPRDVVDTAMACRQARFYYMTGSEISLLIHPLRQP